MKNRFLRPRIIPVLTILGEGLVKTISFRDPNYIGDPINAVKIFNDSEVDELVILDIGTDAAEPNFVRIEELASECFMPVTYGGKLRRLDQVEKVIRAGIEKVSFNWANFYQGKLLTDSAKIFGSSSIVASIDVRKNFWGKYEVMVDHGKTSTKMSAVEFAKQVEDLGAGEILLTSITNEGTGKSYDFDLIHQVSSSVKIPVVANGGANTLAHMKTAIEKGASAAAASSLFVYHGRLKGILINYPSSTELLKVFAGS